MNFRFDNLEKPKATSYKGAKFYARLADKKVPWQAVPSSSTYSAPTAIKYKGQDINLGQCPVNNTYTSLPPGTDFHAQLVGPASSNRRLYSSYRTPDGQYFYPNMEQYEPMLNGKRLMYDTSFEEMNPIPGIKQIGYRRKLYPLTDEYMRELSVYADETLPYPNY